ncbi:MAG: tryptophan-rich sensory protein [Bacteroidales bacterium]|nr:tryptophan-rich sensory protein [Bacteroidales bacterium]
MIKYLNIVFFLVMIVMNYLANALPLNNKTTGQLSDALPNLFVPAGLTFSIWGVIYLLIAVFCVVQFAGSNQAAISRIGWWFGASCLLNSLWIVAWHYQKLPLSMIIMLGMLLTLIYINMQIRDLPFGVVKAAFGIYLGWICIATIANVTALLVHYNWSGGGISEQTWTIIMISAGLLIAAVTLLRLQNPFLGLAVAWAFLGIWIKRQEDFRAIAITALVAMILVTLITIWGFIRKKTGIVN